jgi:aminopeptidase N
MKALVLLVLWILGMTSGAQSPSPRLPGGVKPLRYAIRLEPDVERAAFSGRVEIEIEVQEAKREIVLHSLKLQIISAKIDGVAVTAKADDATQRLTLSGKEVGEGKHRVEIEYSGKIDERPQGLFFARYQLPDGTWQKALCTQMEPTDARRMFPCWDEPAYRSVFQLTAVVPAKHTALFNMPIEREAALPADRKEVVFGTSPSMPSYLVAFASAELDSIEDEVAGVKLRVLGTPGKREKMRYAMEVTKKVLPWFNEYFGVKYPLPKLDQVAFPSTGFGGMENWGCIVYSDTALLFDEANGSQWARERVFGVVTHEIAHQWFGDLVTMEWWDDLWLNEGFASWMATKVGAHFNPTWKKWERSAASKELAMRLDARATTHPIQQEVVNESQAMQAFDEITYQKGQAFLRMLESWLGEEKFRTGLRAYFKKHAYGNTKTSDLWKALAEASGQDVEAVARGWTEQPGFPLVTISLTPSGAALVAQERFAIHQEKPVPLKWQIPVAVRGFNPGEDSKVYLLGDLRTQANEKPGLDGLSLQGEPILANAGAAGYFRVMYDAALWGKLKPRLPVLIEADRLNIMHDAWALVQAKKLPLSRWLELAETLREDPSPLVGGQIVGVLDMLDYLLRGSEDRTAFRKWAREFVAPRWKTLGWEARAGEDLATAGHRAEVIRILGEFGDPEILAAARRRADQFMAEAASLPGDLRETVLSLAGREADAAFWDRLHALAKKTTDTDQKQILYGALAAAREPALAKRALAISLAQEMPAKSSSRMVGQVAADGEHPELAWEFARANMEDLLALCSAGDASEYMARLCRNFSEVVRADELDALTRSSLPAAALRPAAIAIDDIRFKADFKERVRSDLAPWLKAREARGSGR